MSFSELEKLMKKGEAPNVIYYKGIVFKYQGRHATKEEKLKDIQSYGLWNNGGYCSDYGDFLLDYIIDNDYNKSDIQILPDIDFEKKESKDIPLIPDDELYSFNNPRFYFENQLRQEEKLDYNFKVLKEKINQIIKEINNGNS